MSSNSTTDSPPPTLLTIGNTKETPITNDNQNNYLERYMWRSCCGMMIDRRAVIFFSQLAISISIIIFCMTQLWIHHEDCDKNQLYTGILMTIVGVHLPQPKMHKS